jgi:hypothetical protein
MRVETIKGVLIDLTVIAQQLPVGGERAEVVASMLSQLSGELAEVAEVLRDKE